ncbi:MAG TPA: hypothetical protein VNE71_09120 [Myxococcota bacterium]|nr:hypothetical protein [Myxococcota bacterium]
MKAVAFGMGCSIAVVGGAGLVAPHVLLAIAAAFVAPGAVAFYGLAAVRIGLGVLLITVAPASRAPSGLRLLGVVVTLLGVTTAVAGLAGAERARAMIEAWARLGPGVVRLTAVPILVLGGFVAFACAPGVRRSA